MSTSVPPPNVNAPKPATDELPPAPALRGPRVKLLGSFALVAVLGALGLIAFGGGANRLVDPVAEAATVSANTPGYRMTFSIEIASSVTSSPITGTGTGTFDLRDRTGSMSMTMNLGSAPQVIQALGSNALTIQEIVHGTTIYMKLPAAITSVLPTSGKQWIALDLAKLSAVPGLSSLAGNPVSSDPTQMLQYLRAVSDSVVADGHQRVDGVETTRYRAAISLDRVTGALPPAAQAAVQQALATLEQTLHVHAIPVEVWIDAHRLVRRIEMALTMSAPGGQAVEENMRFDISDYGPQPQPALPAAGQVANLNALLGAGG